MPYSIEALSREQIEEIKDQIVRLNQAQKQAEEEARVAFRALEKLELEYGKQIRELYDLEMREVPANKVDVDFQEQVTLEAGRAVVEKKSEIQAIQSRIENERKQLKELIENYYKNITFIKVDKSASTNDQKDVLLANITVQQNRSVNPAAYEEIQKIKMELRAEELNRRYISRMVAEKIETREELLERVGSLINAGVNRTHQKFAEDIEQHLKRIVAQRNFYKDLPGYQGFRDRITKIIPWYIRYNPYTLKETSARPGYKKTYDLHTSEKKLLALLEAYQELMEFKNNPRVLHANLTPEMTDKIQARLENLIRVRLLKIELAQLSKLNKNQNDVKLHDMQLIRQQIEELQNEYRSQAKNSKNPFLKYNPDVEYSKLLKNVNGLPKLTALFDARAQFLSRINLSLGQELYEKYDDYKSVKESVSAVETATRMMTMSAMAMGMMGAMGGAFNVISGAFSTVMMAVAFPLAIAGVVYTDILPWVKSVIKVRNHKKAIDELDRRIQEIETLKHEDKLTNLTRNDISALLSMLEKKALSYVTEKDDGVRSQKLKKLNEVRSKIAEYALQLDSNKNATLITLPDQLYQDFKSVMDKTHGQVLDEVKEDYLNKKQEYLEKLKDYEDDRYRNLLSMGSGLLKIAGIVMMVFPPTTIAGLVVLASSAVIDVGIKYKWDVKIAEFFRNKVKPFFFKQAPTQQSDSINILQRLRQSQLESNVISVARDAINVANAIPLAPVSSSEKKNNPMNVASYPGKYHPARFFRNAMDTQEKLPQKMAELILAFLLDRLNGNALANMGENELFSGLKKQLLKADLTPQDIRNKEFVENTIAYQLVSKPLFEVRSNLELEKLKNMLIHILSSKADLLSIINNVPNLPHIVTYEDKMAFVASHISEQLMKNTDVATKPTIEYERVERHEIGNAYEDGIDVEMKYVARVLVPIPAGLMDNDKLTPIVSSALESTHQQAKMAP